MRGTVSDSTVPPRMNFIEEHLIPGLRAIDGEPLVGANACFEAMDTAGLLILGERGSAKRRLQAFTRNYLPTAYAEIVELLSLGVRSGIGYTALPRGGMLPRDDRPERHLEYLEEGVWIHVPSLTRDVVDGLIAYRADLERDEDLKRAYRRVVDESARHGLNGYRSFLRRNGIEPRTDRNVESRIDFALE